MRRAACNRLTMPRALGEPGVDESLPLGRRQSHYRTNWTAGTPQSRIGHGSGCLDQATYTRYPVSVRGEAPQYAAHYFTLLPMEGVKAMEVSLAMPDSAPLIDADITGNGCYSNRGDMTDTTLTRAFDLTGVTSATLDYRLWYHLEDLWDYGYVMVSEDDGATWDIIPTPHTTSDNPYGTSYGDGYTGTSGGSTATWDRTKFDLAGCLRGENILVRFETITDDAVNQAGVAMTMCASRCAELQRRL